MQINETVLYIFLTKCHKVLDHKLKVCGTQTSE